MTMTLTLTLALLGTGYALYAWRKRRLLRYQALERHAARPARAALRPVGACYYCGEAVPAGRLFCDAECGWAWEDQRRTLEAQWLGRIGR